MTLVWRVLGLCTSRSQKNRTTARKCVVPAFVLAICLSYNKPEMDTSVTRIQSTRIHITWLSYQEVKAIKAAKQVTIVWDGGLTFVTVKLLNISEEWARLFNTCKLDSADFLKQTYRQFTEFFWGGQQKQLIQLKTFSFHNFNQVVVVPKTNQSIISTSFSRDKVINWTERNIKSLLRETFQHICECQMVWNWSTSCI